MSSSSEALQEGTFGKVAAFDPEDSFGKKFLLEDDMRKAGNEKLLKLFQEKIRNTYYDDYDPVIENYRQHLAFNTLPPPPKKGFFSNFLKKNPNPYDGGRGRKSRKGRKGRKGRRGRKSRKR